MLPQKGSGSICEAVSDATRVHEVGRVIPMTESGCASGQLKVGSDLGDGGDFGPGPGFVLYALAPEEAVALSRTRKDAVTTAVAIP